MRRHLSLRALAFWMVLSQFGGVSAALAQTQPTEERPVPPSIRLNVVEKRYFSEREKKRLDRVIPMVERILSSKAFRDAVYDFKYDGKLQFHQSEGLTNAQIYQKLMEGLESYAPGSVNTVDLYLSMYYSKKRVVGFTNPDTRYIYVNNKYYTYSSEDWWTDASVAANIVHEWTHKLGFDHDSNYSWSRNYSVPYGIQSIVEKLGTSLLEGKPLD